MKTSRLNGACIYVLHTILYISHKNPKKQFDII